MSERSAQAIKRALDCGRSGCTCRGGQVTHCPGPSHANGDRNPSLGVTEKDGKVLVTCYGTCGQDDVIAALQARDLWPRREAVPDRNQDAMRVVATYDYHNPDGSLAFQVIRKEGHAGGERRKSFSQRRPDGRGGWIWKKGDTRVLYRLPEVLAADPAEIVWLCEGEKDADRLSGCGLVATTRAEGAGKWQPDNADWLRGRRVVILQDNDEPGRKDARLKRESLRSVAAEAAILALDALPEHGDVSDWLALGGTLDHLIALGEAALAGGATEDEPEARVPLALPTPAVLGLVDADEPSAMPPFPVEILPPAMADLVTSASVALSVPPEFVAVPLLVLAGAVIGNAWCIEIKKGWREGPSLYAAVVGDPGSGKTPALKLALRPINEIQKRLADEYREQKRAYDAALAVWEGSNKNTRGAKPEAPTFRHVWTTDPTTEALASLLVGTKGLAYTRDELAGWVASMDAYRSGKGADRQHYLSMWAAASIKIDRRSQPDPIIVENPCLSIVGGIQPDKLPSLVERGDTDDGFLDRMLWSYPDPGTSYWTDAGVDEALEQAVTDLFVALHRLQPYELPSGKPVPHVARLDDRARMAWQQWYDARYVESQQDGFEASLKGTWAKLPAQLARVTLILHVAWAVDAGQRPSLAIPVETVAAAADMMEYFKEHARFSLASVRTSRSTLQERIVRLLGERGPQTTRQLFQAVGGRVKADRLNGALERLVEDGRVERRIGTPGEQGGRPAKVWAVAEGAEPVSFTRRSEARAWKS